MLLSLLNNKELTRFESKLVVDSETGCWDWTGSLCGELGYGHVTLTRLGTLLRRGRVFRAHRVAKSHYHGVDIQSDLLARHTCDNPRCCNPDHIVMGTHQDNMADMVSRQRAKQPDSSGQNNGNAVLTADDVVVIRNMLATKNNTVIGRIFGVHHSTISAIRRGKTWVTE